MNRHMVPIDRDYRLIILKFIFTKISSEEMVIVHFDFYWENEIYFLVAVLRFANQFKLSAESIQGKTVD